MQVVALKTFPEVLNSPVRETFFFLQTNNLSVDILILIHDLTLNYKALMCVVLAKKVRLNELQEKIPVHL